MEENNTSDSWLDDLTDLIKRKQEENEMLNKLRLSLDLPGPGNEKPTTAGDDIDDDSPIEKK